MKVNITKNIKRNLPPNMVNINIECNEKQQGIESLIKHIKNYNNIVLVKKDDNSTIEEILCDDIVLFFSKDGINYCKTVKDLYKIKDKLYEIENLSINYIRISKNCIVNVQHIKNFDISETGKIKVNLDNGDFELVSRRRKRDVIEFFDERMI